MKITFRLFFIVILTLMLSLAGCVQEEKSKGLSLGDSAPDFAIKDLDGQVTVLSNLKGTPVILRFFEANCRFCRADTPAFNNFYDQNKEKVRILYVGSFYENEQSLRTFAEELGLLFPVAVDTKARLADLYGIRAYPQTLFISPEQEILAALLGGVGEAELIEILGKFL